MARVNYQVLMRERGKVVPGSRLEGHNIFTEFGRQTLTQLVGWSSVSDPDVAYTDHRFRWVGLGSSSRPETDPVPQLVSPLEVTTGPSVYLAELDAGSTDFPLVTSVRFFKEFSTTDLSFGGAVVVREMGLFMDSSPGLSLDPSVGTNEPSAYVVFPQGLVKMPSFTFEVKWEMKL